MKKSRILLAISLLIVAMFFLSFLITITASRVIPPKEKPDSAKQSAARRANALSKPTSKQPTDYFALVRKHALSGADYTTVRRDEVIEEGAAAFPQDSDLQLLLRDVRLRRMLAMPFISEESLGEYKGYIDSIKERFPNARIDLARSLIRMRRLPDAIETLREFLGREPDNVIGNYYLGEAFARSLRLRDSERHLKISLEHCKEFEIASELLPLVTKAQTLSNLPATGIPDIKALSEMEIPTDGLLAIGELLLWLDDADSAEIAFRLVLFRENELAEAYKGLARVFLAQAIARPTDRLYPGEELDLLYHAATALESARKYDSNYQHLFAHLANDLRAQRANRNHLMLDSALALYLRDTKQIPDDNDKTFIVDSIGRAPKWDHNDLHLSPSSGFLIANEANIPGWNGPYLLAPDANTSGGWTLFQFPEQTSR